MILIIYSVLDREYIVDRADAAWITDTLSLVQYGHRVLQ